MLKTHDAVAFSSPRCNSMPRLYVTSSRLSSSSNGDLLHSLISNDSLITSMTHVPVLLENQPHVPLRSLRFARFLSTGGDKPLLPTH